MATIACLRPKVLTVNGYKLSIRCTKCSGCRLRHKMVWTGRCLLEARDHNLNRCLTLTYRDPEKQRSPLHYPDVQLFLKTYRERTSTPFRYFAVGEYGEENGNAHWHVIIFGHGSIQPEGFDQAVPVVLPGWTKRFGYSSDMEVNRTTAAYVAGYTQKKGENSTPFMRCSLRPSIGFSAIDRWAAECARRIRVPVHPPTSFSIDGKAYPLCDGLLKRFKASFTASGGSLVPFDAEAAHFDAAAYSLSAEYLGTDVSADQRRQLNGTASQPLKNQI